MRKNVIYSLLLMSIAGNATAQCFIPASEPDLLNHYNPVVPFEHSSAYHLKSSTNEYYYIHSWDPGDNQNVNPSLSGFEFSKFDDALTTGPSSQIAIFHEFVDHFSMDAKIMEDSSTQDIYVVTTYYSRNITALNLNPRSFNIDIFRWNPNTVQLDRLPGYPQQLSVANLDFGWIRNDVIDNKMSIVWDEQGKLRLMGVVLDNNNFTFTDTMEVNDLLGNPMTFSQPDIASVSIHGDVYNYIIATDDTKHELFVFDVPFDNFFIANAGISSIVAQSIHLDAVYNLPRIDGLDYDSSILVQEKAWASVVQMYDDILNTEEILGNIYYEDAGLGNLHHVTLSTNQMCDISDRINYKPVVSFSKYDDQAVYFGWYHQNQSFEPGLSGDYNAYIGSKVNFDGTLYWAPGYYVIPEDVYSTPAIPALAFSGNNLDYGGDGGLYAAFKQEGFELKHAYKQMEYGQGFKPLDISEISTELSLGISPNPYNNYFTVQSNNPSSELFRIHIMDVLGREVFSGEGLLPHINASLKEKSGDWESGIYIIHIENTSKKERQTLKISKMN